MEVNLSLTPVHGHPQELFQQTLKKKRSSLDTINNCVAKWRLGACDTQELPLLAASS